VLVALFVPGPPAGTDSAGPDSADVDADADADDGTQPAEPVAAPAGDARQ
jgi:hypothetical protein